ncbi:hypothetical protein GN244_ATG16497 [Phytophthora infestans]|nr:hypothetical protein GN244_ATG16497 [Phytophthora infestans]
MDQQPARALSETLNHAFHSFTALVREEMIASATRYRYLIRNNDKIWNQRWLLEPGSVEILEISADSPTDYWPEMRLVDIVQLLSEVGCVDLTVNDDASWLALRSAMSTSTSAPMTLITDGNLHLFRVLPSGTPSMIATTGGWVIGDYTATFSEVGHSLEVNLYSYAEEEAEGAHLTHLTSQESVNVRRVSLSIRLEEKKNEIAAELTRHKMLIALVRGTVYGSSLSLPLNECKNGFNLSERSAVDRAGIWSEVEWTAWWEFKADYIAMARSYS